MWILAGRGAMFEIVRQRIAIHRRDVFVLREVVDRIRTSDAAHSRHQPCVR